MKNSFKKYWKEFVIGILVIFGMSKCTSSCSNKNALEKAEQVQVQKDSTIQSLQDSIVVLNTKIQIYEEKVAGLNQSLSIQNEAARRILEAKKNISVSVRK